jgi:hypothetical protein
MTDSKPAGFWQTLPGIITALAGLITAAAIADPEGEAAGSAREKP